MSNSKDWFKKWDRYIKRDKQLKRLLVEEYNFKRKEKSVESFDDFLYDVLQEVVTTKNEALENDYMFPSLKSSLGSAHRIIQLFIILTLNDLFEDEVYIVNLYDNLGHEMFISILDHDNIPLENIEFKFPEGFNIRW